MRFASNANHNNQPLVPSQVASSPDQIDTSDMVGILKAILTPLLRQWVKRNQNIDSKVLVVYLTSATTEFCTNFINK
jgi:hypothetical protein